MATSKSIEQVAKGIGLNKGAYLHLVGSTGPVIDTVSAGEGVEHEFLVPAHITMVKWHNDKPKPWWKAEDFDINDRLYTYVGKKTELVEKLDPATGKVRQYRRKLKVPIPGLYEVGIAQCQERNECIVDAASIMYNEGLTILILVTHIDHGLWLKKHIEESIHTPVLFVKGSNPQKEREQVKRALDTGQTRVCIATTVFDEGVDVPSIDGLIYARGGKAQHRVVQALGRGMRPKPGKTELEVVDFMDTHSRTLFRHANDRLEAYESDKKAYTVTIEEM